MTTVSKVIALAVIAIVGVAATAGAVQVYTLHDHPDGFINPPSYGLRLDDLLGSGEYTFSFDYMDITGTAMVTLTYNDIAGTIHIAGRAYGGKDIGGSWDATEKGWIDIDFTFVDNVSEQDDCPGNAGDDLWVTGESASNTGTITLDGWGGNQVFVFTDKADGSGCTFAFDNDEDPKGNNTIANDPTIYSGWGWLMPPTSGSRDWLFIAEQLTVPVEQSSWGRVKSLYGNE